MPITVLIMLLLMFFYINNWDISLLFGLVISSCILGLYISIVYFEPLKHKYGYSSLMFILFNILLHICPLFYIINIKVHKLFYSLLFTSGILIIYSYLYATKIHKIYAFIPSYNYLLFIIISILSIICNYNFMV